MKLDFFAEIDRVNRLVTMRGNCYPDSNDEIQESTPQDASTRKDEGCADGSPPINVAKSPACVDLAIEAADRARNAYRWKHELTIPEYLLVPLEGACIYCGKLTEDKYDGEFAHEHCGHEQDSVLDSPTRGQAEWINRRYG